MFIFDDAKKTDIEEEIELIKAYKNGDENALEEICKLNYKFINYIIEKRFNFLNHLKEDLFQEGLLGLYRAVESFDEEKAYGYIRFKYLHIFGAMKRYALKDNKYVNFTSLVDHENDEDAKGEDFNWLEGMTEDDTQERWSDAQEAWALLEGLPEKEKNVIVAKFRGDCHKQISQREGFNSRTLVDYYFKRGINNIRRALKDDSEIKSQGFHSINGKKISR